MAGNHGARQQKRVAKQKAKSAAKRARLQMRTSTDPSVRLKSAEKWPVMRALAGSALWKDGIGYMVIVRREAEGQFVFAVFLVDVYCLGVKNAFWRAGTKKDVDELNRRMEETQKMREITPACLAKIVTEAVAYAKSFGFPPHPDYRHAAMLLAGIDPSTCPDQFTFGRDGKPFYIQGPHESSAQAAAIMERIQDAGGHFLIGGPMGGFDLADSPETDGFADDDDDDDDESDGDKSEWL